MTEERLREISKAQRIAGRDHKRSYGHNDPPQKSDKWRQRASLVRRVPFLRDRFSLHQAALFPLSNKARSPSKSSVGDGGQPLMCKSTGNTSFTPPSTA